MNLNLLKNTIEYHGKNLFTKICEENRDEIIKLDNSVFIDSLSNHEKKSVDFSDEISLLKSSNENRFYDGMLNFIAKKSKFLFKDISNANKTTNQNESIDEEVYPMLPPLEKFMHIPAYQAKTHFFKYLEIGDVVIGNITSVSERGLYVQLMCFDSITKKKREIDFLKIIAFCSVIDVQQFAGAKALINLFQPSDIIRCVVKSIDEYKETCDVCFEIKDKSTKLGLISLSECPTYYHNSLYYDKYPTSYAQLLKRDKSFNNSASIGLLAKKLGLDIVSKFSLMNSLASFEVKREEMANELRRRQTRNLALLRCMNEFLIISLCYKTPFNKK